MEIILNDEQMRKYYEELDVVKFKYQYLLGFYHAQYQAYYLKFQDYEDSQQFEELTKKEFIHMQANLDLAYADKVTTDKYLGIYDIVSEKIIRKYINIDGIERLFSEKYADFEWEMHMGMDYKRHSMNFYRDHFIHQVKDAYTMVILLEQGGFFEKVSHILKGTAHSKISRFVGKLLKQQLYLPVRKPFEGIREDLLEKHYFHNIVYMASYMAGLFHDIGYPATMMMQENRRMIDYLAETSHFEQGNYDFNRIMSLLQNSLLFRVVPPREIRARIEGDKVDHGTMSALLFLLHFYENGVIHRLEPYKLCAVELAALAIYNHTNRYEYIGQKNPNYQRCVFALNPISYLLRICDDMQEWGRIYFEVSNQNHLILCSSCHMPVIRRKRNNDDGDVEYCCGCHSKGNTLFEPLFRDNQFPSRRLYNVTVCREIVVTMDDEFKNYEFSMKYGLAELLHIAYLNSGYAKYRIEELQQLKKFFPRQHVLEKVFVGYFMTSNIILIKAAIVGRYIEKLDTGGKIREAVLTVIKEAVFWGTDWEDVFAGLKVLAKSVEAEKVKELYSWSQDDAKLNAYLEEAFCVYLFVAMLMFAGRAANTEKWNKRDIFIEGIHRLAELLCEKGITKKGFLTEDVRVLLNDCGTQAGRLYDNLHEYDCYPDDYMQMFQTENTCYDVVEHITDLKNYKPVAELGLGEQHMDAYTDLYCIKSMLNEISDM